MSLDMTDIGKRDSKHCTCQDRPSVFQKDEVPIFQKLVIWMW